MTIRRGTTTSVLALLLAFGTVIPANGQTAAPQDSLEIVSWPEHFGEQVQTLLRTGDAERQEKAVRLVLEYAGRDDLSIDFRPAEPELIRLYEEAGDESLRIMALNALSAVGGELSMETLATQVRYEESDRVRQQMLRVLSVRLQRQSEER